MSNNPQAPRPGARRRGSEAITVVLVLASVVAVIGLFVADRVRSSGSTKSVSAGPGLGEAAGAATTTAAGAPNGSDPQAAPATTVAAATEGEPAGPELDESETGTGTACKITTHSLQMGSAGPSVTCLQQALAAAGLYSGAVSGQYDAGTYAAVRKAQEQRELFVDGNVGRETALSLGIWPDESSLVVRTPPPAPGAVDSMGFKLSSVSSTGAGAPPLPANSGAGRRLVYDRAGQRVWAVGKNGDIIRSWLVSGSKFNNETPGTHEVYSKSEVSTAWNGKAYLPRMVRWLKTDRGHIGFHGIPTHVNDRSPYQTEAELGTRLSGGCQRQANPDAAFVWAFATIGTKVVVL